MKYHSLKPLLKKIILIDGISRTGKMLLGSLVSSFRNSEHLEFGENFEHFCPAITYKKINIDFARSYMINYLNELIYNKYLSRKVNFRFSDRTGIANSLNPDVYKKRLKVKEGDDIISLIKKEKKQVPFITHDLLINIMALNELNIDYKMVEIFRNPINIVMSWYKRGLGNRYGKDQRMFTLLIKKNRKIYPWYDQLKNQNIDKINELEKCINYVYNLTKCSIKNFKKLNSENQRKIYFCTYEAIITNTLIELKKISKFLNLDLSSSTIKFIKKENCPKKFDILRLNQNRNYIKSNVSRVYYNKILSLEEEFNNKTFELSK